MHTNDTLSTGAGRPSDSHGGRMPDPAFGAVMSTDGTPPVWTPALRERLLRQSYLIFRDVQLADTDALQRYAETVGRPIDYAFGTLFEIQPKPSDGRTQLSNRMMTIHQDSVLPEQFADVVLLYCWASPSHGGECLFCDNRAFLRELGAREPEIARAFEHARVTYENHTESYYLGNFGKNATVTKPTRKLHPVTRESMPYFALHDRGDDRRNFSARFEGVSEARSLEMMEAIEAVFRSPAVMREVAVRPGDLLILDNLLVSHGRNGFPADQVRRLSRVQLSVY